jgi:hypothetical protein
MSRSYVSSSPSDFVACSGTAIAFNIYLRGRHDTSIDFNLTILMAVYVKEKGKAVPLHAMEALGGRGGIAPTHLDLGTRWGCVVSVTPRPRFTPGEWTPGTHCTGGWVGPRAGLDTEDRGKIFCPRRGSNPDRPVVQPVVRHYSA